MIAGWGAVAWGVAAALGTVATTPRAHAQLSRQLRPEIRVDAIVARRSAVHAGLGASVPLARAVRLELAGGAGSTIGRGDDGFSGRVDVIGRFLLDPEYQFRWGAYVGGGLSLRYDHRSDWRGFLGLVLGLEAPRRGGIVPFFEVGYGGGVRIGAGVRRAVPGSR